MTNYGYARCSTNEARQDIERQKRELMEYGVKNENIFWEYESGTKDDRQQLNRLLKIVEPGDSIISLEVSRLTRSTQKLCEIIRDIQEKQIRLIISGSLTIDCSPGKEVDPLTKGMLMMWGVFAELEHDMIVQRVRSGLRNAREKGKKLGRPQTTAEKIPPVFYRYYPQYRNGQINLSEFSRLCGMTRPTIYKYLHIAESSS